MKICIVLTTRGTIAKFTSIMDIIKADDFLELQTVVGGELVLEDRITKPFDPKPDYIVNYNLPGDSPECIAKSTGLAVEEFSNAFHFLKPDLVMVVGDRYETLAAVTAAYIMGIDIAHLEGGEVSGTLDDGFRWAITHLSTLHFPCTEDSVKRLRSAEFLWANNVGSTSLDLLSDGYLKGEAEFVSLQKVSGIGGTVNPLEPFLLVAHHPDTSNPKDIKNEMEDIVMAVHNSGMQAVYVSSNMDAGNSVSGGVLKEYMDEYAPDNVRCFKSLSFDYYGYLLKTAACIVGNSSSGVREASFFGTPNICVGDRQEGREHSDNTTFCKADRKEILRLIQYNAIYIGKRDNRHEPDYRYGNGTAGRQIVDKIRRHYAKSD